MISKEQSYDTDMATTTTTTAQESTRVLIILPNTRVLIYGPDSFMQDNGEKRGFLLVTAGHSPPP